MKSIRMTSLFKRFSKLFIFGGFLLTFQSCMDDESNARIDENCQIINFKYYQGEKDTLGEVSKDYLLIGIDSNYSENEINEFIATLNHFNPNCLVLKIVDTFSYN